MEKGFDIKVSSRYDGLWRYNMALTCGCFDAQERQTEFVSASSHVADVGANLPAPPEGIAPRRGIALATPPCDHIRCFLYLIPHTLPAGDDIEATAPFEVEVRISYAGRPLSTARHRINLWSGASIELRASRGE